jgi:transcriptional regulator with XRE-family HTH domain
MKGLDVDKNAIQRIESGERFVTDIELKMMASVLDVSVDALLSDPND